MGILKSIGLKFKELFAPAKSAQLERLKNQLSTYELELKHLCNGKENEAWALAANESLSNAKEAAKAKQINKGWEHFHLAKTLEVHGFDPDQLSIAAASLRRMACKLSENRKKSIHDMLGTPEQPKSAGLNEVFHSAKLFYEGHNTKYHKIRLRKNNLKIMSVTTIVAVITLLASSQAFDLPDPFNNGKRLMLIALMGVMGGVISTAMTLTNKSIQADLPDQLMGSFITFMRPVIGGAAAILSYVFIESGLLDDSIQRGLQNEAGYYTLAFIAGFSERFIVNVVGKIENKS